MMFRLILRFRFPILAAAALVTIALGSQLHHLVLEPDAEAYVPDDHPVRVYWQEAKDRFGLGRDILVAVEAAGPHGVFTPAALAGVARLTDIVEGVDGVASSEVRSLSNSEAMVGTVEGLEVEPFFDLPPQTQVEADDVRRHVFANPVFINRLVSQDATIAAIFAKVEVDNDEAPEVYARILAAVSDVEIERAKVLVAGNPGVEYVYGRQMSSDLERLIPLALATVIVILYVCFPSPRPPRIALRAAAFAAAFFAFTWWRDGTADPLVIGGASLVAAMLTAPGVLLPCLVVVMSVVWTWGLQAVLGLPIYLAGTLVPPLLLAIGSAEGIHIVGRFLEIAREPGADKAESVVATMEQLWRPVVLTATTTAAGFGSLALGDMTVYQVFGITTAFGVLAAMVISLFVLPALMSLMPLPKLRTGHGTRSPRISRVLTWIAERLEAYRVAVLVSTGLVLAGLSWSATGLVVDYSWVESLAPGTPVLEADRILRHRHGGTMPLNVIVRATEIDGIKEPELLYAIDRVLTELAEDPLVGDTRSIAEYLKRMSQTMNEDRPDAYRLPDSKELVAQYLLLYSMSGDPGEYDDLVDYDYQAANLSILLRTDSLADLSRILSRLEALLDMHVRPLGATATVTGSAHLMNVVFAMVMSTQVQSLATTATIVVLFLIVILRSVRDALICILPLTVTAVANFGIMAALGIPLGPDKAMIGAIALGIGIDYSIHLMSRFHDTLEAGMSVFQGVVEAVRSTGRSILFNGVVVVAGFLVIGSSVTPSNASFGLMIANNIALSCVTAMVVLPAALAVVGYYEFSRSRHAPVRIAGRVIKADTARALGLGGDGGI
jgi:predicted RND superfamily exporter protein